MTDGHAHHPQVEKPPILVELEKIEHHLARLDRVIVSTVRWTRIRTMLTVLVQLFWILVFAVTAWQVITWTRSAYQTVLELLERPAQLQQSAVDTVKDWTALPTIDFGGLLPGASSVPPPRTP